MSQIAKIICRFETQGRVSSMKYSDNSNACLVSTIMNGSHIFNMGNTFDKDASCATTTSVESFPHHIIGEDPIISSCFLSADSSLAVGSAMGGIAVVSRSTRTVVGSYSFQEGAPVLSLEQVPHEPSLLLSSTPDGAYILDVEYSSLKLTLMSPKPRVVGALALTPNCFVTANYDGKVMLYDARQGCDPLTILSIPDQLTSVAASPRSGAVAAGTVGGRIFILRCLGSSIREQAFGTGKIRAPIRCISAWIDKVSAGDVSTKLTLIDTGDNPEPTTYWTGQCILPEHSQPAPTDSSWSVSATVLCKGALWGALTSPDSTVSQVVAISV